MDREAQPSTDYSLVCWYFDLGSRTRTVVDATDTPVVTPKREKVFDG